MGRAIALRSTAATGLTAHAAAVTQIVSGTSAMAPHGHSAMQMPQPLQ